MNIRSPRFTEAGTIVCEIEHPVFGWIEFHATPDDGEEHGRAIYAAAMSMGPAAYVPASTSEPTPAQLLAAERAAMSAPFPDIALQLALADWITEAEYYAWLSRNAVPSVIADQIAELPTAAERMTTTRYALGSDDIQRMHPLVLQLAEVKRHALGLSEEDMALAVDNLFRAAMGT